MINLIVDIDGVPRKITLKEARRLWEELDSIFNNKPELLPPATIHDLIHPTNPMRYGN